VFVGGLPMQGRVEVCGVNTSKLKILKNDETMKQAKTTISKIIF